MPKLTVDDALEEVWTRLAYLIQTRTDLIWKRVGPAIDVATIADIDEQLRVVTALICGCESEIRCLEMLKRVKWECTDSNPYAAKRYDRGMLTVKIAPPRVDAPGQVPVPSYTRATSTTAADVMSTPPPGLSPSYQLAPSRKKPSDDD